MTVDSASLEAGAEFIMGVRLLPNGKPQSGPGPSRVMVLGDGDGRVASAAVEAGHDVVYTRGVPLLGVADDFEGVPALDLIVAVLPGGEYRNRATLTYVSRFLRVRRPMSFVLFSFVGPDEGLLEMVEGALGGAGYSISSFKVVGGATGDAVAFWYGTRHVLSLKLSNGWRIIDAPGEDDLGPNHGPTPLVRRVLEWAGIKARPGKQADFNVEAWRML